MNWRCIFGHKWGDLLFVQEGRRKQRCSHCPEVRDLGRAVPYQAPAKTTFPSYSKPLRPQTPAPLRPVAKPKEPEDDGFTSGLITGVIVDQLLRPTSTPDANFSPASDPEPFKGGGGESSGAGASSSWDGGGSSSSSSDSGSSSSSDSSSSSSGGSDGS